MLNLLALTSVMKKTSVFGLVISKFPLKQFVNFLFASEGHSLIN